MLATKTSAKILKEVYKPQPVEAHKYDNGLLLIIGGSEFYSGSPALSAFAAFKAGVDMVQIIAPERAANIIASFSPILAAYPLKSERLTKKDLPTILAMTKSAQIVAKDKVAVLIGGGLGRSKETQDTILEYLSQISVPVVIDADAIHALAKNPKVIAGKPVVVTPHLYEFYVLTGKEVIDAEQGVRQKLVFEEAKRLRTTILLKSKIDIISDGKELVLNETGTPYMSVGGTGDTLAGICGSLVARGASPFLAAQAAAYINGKAGEIAAEKLKMSLTATDLIDAIPEVVN
jgi:NAD(P)H-hydrate epimerase